MSERVKKELIKTRNKRKEPVVFYENFEHVLQKINPFGPYQIFCFIVILYASIEWAGNSTFMYVIGSFEPDWNCTLIDNSTMKISAPTNDVKCAFIKSNCTSFQPIRENLEFFSLVAQFKLICDDENKIEWIEVILAGSALIGSIIGGHMGDHFGRQTIFFIAQLLIIITSMMSTASQNWIAFAVIQGVNCFLYGVIETTSLTMMMEYTSNKFRVIMVNAFQWPIAYMTIALIAFLTKDWQNYFVFLNLVSSPLAIGFMLFLESPRWLISRNRLSEACEVLNDIGHQRWNNTKAKFTTNDLATIHKPEKQGFYTFLHLFSNKRLAKQSCLQILSVLTYAMVSNTYLFTVSGMHDSAIMFTFLDGVFRLIVPVVIVIIDLYIPAFTRRKQYLISLLIEGVLFAVVIGLVASGTCTYVSLIVTILIIITTMINDCVFWINICQITAQRYPTVIRCVAFGFLHSFKHLGAIVGYVILRPLLISDWPTLAFIIPEALIVISIVAGFFFQPETKGKALLDQMIETDYSKMEYSFPTALMNHEPLNEAEKAMLAAKKRHEDDDQAKLQDYEERRRSEREKEEEELKKLKEKQEQRRLQREQEEREAAERRRQDEERRKKEEEDRRTRAEEEKRRKEEDKLKKAQMMGGGFTPGQQGSGRNFVIQKKEDSGVGDRFGNIVQAKQEMGMTKEQQEEAKSAFMAQIRKNIPDSSSILPNDLKAKIKELHQRICKLEAQKYDQEKRHERQEYDLKELNERSRQVARANIAKNGLLSTDDTGGRHPPKVQISSKYDRQIDRRNFKERRSVYENKTAFPCFPGVPPPPALFEKIIKKMDYEIQQELDAAEEEEEEADDY